MIFVPVEVVLNLKYAMEKLNKPIMIILPKIISTIYYFNKMKFNNMKK
jgi:hypothetical protein